MSHNLDKFTLSKPNCKLVLSSGESFTGKLIGSPLPVSGELVFTTGMVGYSEALTDPSYFGQILVFTYPMIGNYGIPRLPEKLSLPIPSGFESSRVHASAVIVTVDSPEVFHWNSFNSLDQWLKEQNTPGISNLDTRHLVHLMRKTPGLKARLEPEFYDQTKTDQHSLSKIFGEQKFFDPSEHNLLAQVSTKERIVLGKGKKRIGLIDCGVKWNIIRQLLALECEVELIPYNADLKVIDCSAWVLSNGPGDPQKCETLIAQVRELLRGSRPILGICLGHQILALAAGAKTIKMKYGHRSHNQPVYLVGTRRGFITSQNHGYVVSSENFPSDWEPWFLNANDQTIEGIRHKAKAFASVQFHPEAAGGPRDTGWIIQQFVTKINSGSMYA